MSKRGVINFRVLALVVYLMTLSCGGDSPSGPHIDDELKDLIYVNGVYGQWQSELEGIVGVYFFSGCNLDVTNNAQGDIVASVKIEAKHDGKVLRTWDHLVEIDRGQDNLYFSVFREGNTTWSYRSWFSERSEAEKKAFFEKYGLDSLNEELPECKLVHIKKATN